MSEAGDRSPSTSTGTAQHAEPGAHETLFWRRLAHWGASRGPEWWLRWSPPFFGWAAALAVPSARHAVVRNLRRIRGPVGPAREAREVLETFANYARCFAEVLSNDAPGGPRKPHGEVYGKEFFRRVGEARRGAVVVTAHTAGWDAVGPLLAEEYHARMLIVMQPEPDARARRIQDEARRRSGVEILHVGDPLGSLTLLRHLREGGIVGLQLDRVAPGMRTRTVTLLGERSVIPEGPLRLAQMSGASLLPVFCARIGHRSYAIEAFEPRDVPRRASDAQVDATAQYLADCMTKFLRQHPTQWFHFGSAPQPGSDAPETRIKPRLL